MRLAEELASMRLLLDASGVEPVPPPLAPPEPRPRPRPRASPTVPPPPPLADLRTPAARRAAAGAMAPPPPPTRPTPPAPAVPPAPPVPPTPATPPRPAAPPPPPPPPGRTLRELAEEWDLVGARGFAIAGGAVMALGIGFFFVLAANRGWVGPGERVALGAIASALVFGAGIVLRARYGEYWAALAAVGAGIAGGYATLAAASARYDLVPDWLALPLAGAIAAVATVVALRWNSQVIAAIGLLGAALAPALQALDTELTWEAGAFAVVVLVAVAACPSLGAGASSSSRLRCSSPRRSSGSRPTRTRASRRERSR